MLTRNSGHIDHVPAQHVTPLAAPLLSKVGKVPIKGHARDHHESAATDALLAGAGLP